MHSISRFVFQILIVVLTFTFLSFAQNFKVIESTSDHITVEFNFNKYYSVYDTLVPLPLTSGVRGKRSSGG